MAYITSDDLEGYTFIKIYFIFVYFVIYSIDREKFNLEEQTKRFSEFDGWRTIQYNFCNAARTAGITKKEDIPVAYFNIEDDW